MAVTYFQIKNRLSELYNDTGFITANDIPVATTSRLGGVKPDGSTITVDANGVISSSGGDASSSTIFSGDFEYGESDGIHLTSPLQTGELLRVAWDGTEYLCIVFEDNGDSYVTDTGDTSPDHFTMQVVEDNGEYLLDVTDEDGSYGSASHLEVARVGFAIGTGITVSDNKLSLDVENLNGVSF